MTQNDCEATKTNTAGLATIFGSVLLCLAVTSCQPHATASRADYLADVTPVVARARHELAVRGYELTATDLRRAQTASDQDALDRYAALGFNGASNGCMSNLIFACLKGDRWGVGSLLATSTNSIAQPYSYGPPTFGSIIDPLSAAAWSGNSGIMELLIEKGADVNARPSRAGSVGFTAFEQAIQTLPIHGHKCVDLLLSAGVDPAFHIDALRELAQGGDKTLIVALLDKSSIPAPRLLNMSVNGVSPLEEAARSCNVDVLELFADKGADFTGRHGAAAAVAILSISGCRATPHTLQEKAEDDAARLAVLRCLVKHGADLNVSDAKGRTPLQVASKCGLLQCEAYIRNVLGSATNASLAPK